MFSVYRYESIGETGFALAEINRAKKEVTVLQEAEAEAAPADKPKTLEQFRTAFMHDKETTRPPKIKLTGIACTFTNN